MEKTNIKKVFWQNIRNRVASVNPALAQKIDEVNPDNTVPLYLARYPYGSVIAEQGLFRLPTADQKTIPITDSSIHPEIKNDFAYAYPGSPIGIVLNNTIEESVENIRGEFVPGTIGRPGSILWLWDRLDRTPLYSPFKMFSVTAGARCIFMLPNIRDLALHKNLKKDFNIKQSPPDTLFDHWNIFKSIVHHPSIQTDWATEIIFLSDEWIKKLRNDASWKSLSLYFHEIAWDRSAYERNLPFYDLAFSKILSNRNLKPNPYVNSTVKHLFMIASGTFSGLGIATDDTYAPVSIIQKVYIESYGLKKYIPTVFLPMLFSAFNNDSPPVYYSLNLPTTFESLPKSRKISSTLHDLCELRHILISFLDEIRRNKLRLDNTIIEKISMNINFDFFHYKPDLNDEIKLASEMIIGDDRFMFCLESFGKREVSDAGSFLRGCVRISHK